jgi:hypothetical protein
MIRLWIACASMLFPLLGMACEGNRNRCQKQFSTLVAYRAQAIESAFGDLFGTLPSHVKIKFVSSRDPEYKRFGGEEAYDHERQEMIIPRRMLSGRTPVPTRWAKRYWPYYESAYNRSEYPIIETIDNLWWSAYLQEAAQERGLSWPDKDCESADVGKRLPCEMVASGVTHMVKDVRGPIFNSNRVDRIWPDDFSEFRKRVWRGGQEYTDVQRYGGIMLVQPLADEFGVARTLMYLAQTPFRIENDNLHTSALRYQQQARAELGAGRVNVAVHPGKESHDAGSSGEEPQATRVEAVSPPSVFGLRPGQ